jgi:hypothetical protein
VIGLAKWFVAEMRMFDTPALLSIRLIIAELAVRPKSCTEKNVVEERDTLPFVPTTTIV